MSTVFWRSWSKLEAAFELERIQKLPIQHSWVNAHERTPTSPNDIWLTTNGYDHNSGNYKKASLYAESYIYLKSQYDIYLKDSRWNHRFHFNPNYAKLNKSTQQGIGCWWLSEMESTYKPIKSAKKIEFVFGMCQGKKTDQRIHPIDHGWLRTEVVKAGKGRSLKYFGTAWPGGDPQYGGEVYLRGHRGTPVKFNDARHLMAPAKFVFTLENIHDKYFSMNYFTEKIFHGFLSYSVPIYLGADNVEELVNPNLFIDLRKFNNSPKEAMDFCEKMPDSEYKGYLDRIEEWLNGNGKEFSCDNRFVDLDRKLTMVLG